MPRQCSRRSPASSAEAPTLGDARAAPAPTLVRDAIPFERLHVLRLDRAESVVLYVARADGELEVTGHRIADAAAGDADAIDADARSRIICTVGSGAASTARSGSRRASPTPSPPTTRP